jgi:PASTA domain
VTGKTTGQAVASLQSANCGAGTQRAAYSSSVKAGNVISQGMAVGIIAANGTPVDFTVSKGAFPSARVAKTEVRLTGTKLILSVRCAKAGSATNGTIKLQKVSGKHQTLGTRSFQCPSGKSRNVIFTFTAKTAGALHKAKRTRLAAFIVSRGPDGGAASRRSTITVQG